RIHARTGTLLEVVQDRVKMSSAEKARVIEGVEAALKIGQGKVNVYPLGADGEASAPWRFSSDLHCADCDIHYSEPLPSLFSFNSPLGACETCRGFGRVIGIDYGLIVPDERKTLREGAGLKADALLWRIEGLSVHDMMLMSIERLRAFFGSFQLPAPLDEATDLLLTEIRARLRYVCEVGLGYLTLDRQSRTLSGGEVQRINLTTALGTSLVNTLFVLDEPSIGLHPRD